MTNMKNIYEEALADVKQMKALAEATAQRKVIEAVTPRIKQLIESELFGDGDEDEEEELEAAPAAPGAAPVKGDLMTDEMTAPEPVGMDTLEVEEPGVVEPLAEPEPVVPAPVVINLDDIGDDEEVELNFESIDSIKPVISRVSVSDLTKKLAEAADRLCKAETKSKLSESYRQTLKKIISRVEDTYSYVQKTVAQDQRAPLEESLEAVYKRLNGLQEQTMSRKNKMINEEDVTLKLTGLPDDIDLDTVGVDLITGSEEGEEGSEEEASEEPAEEGGEEDLFGGDEGGEEEAGGEEEGVEEGLEGLSDDDVVEIDESVLHREIARMKALRESKEKDNSEKGNGPGDVKGMKKAPKPALKEADADEDTLDLDTEEACATEVAAADDGLDEEFELTEPSVEEEDVAKEEVACEAKLRSNLRARIAVLQKEAASRDPKKSEVAKRSLERAKKALAESVKRQETAKNGGSKRLTESEILRGKLAETNLANAKLAFANKLLQNESLTNRQKKQVVDALESVKSVNEAKAVYESLTKALAKKAVNESKVIGSSSRATRPAATVTTTLNEGIETDRWARLAGLK